MATPDLRGFEQDFTGSTCALSVLDPTDIDFAHALTAAVPAQWRYHGVPVPVERLARDLLNEANLSVVVRDHDQEPVGIGVFDGWNLQDRTVNLSLVTTERVRRTRLPMEAFLLCARLAFTTLPLRRVLMQSNALAFREFASAVRRGYVQVLGTLPAHHYHDSGFHDLHLLCVDRSDWRRLEEVGHRLFRYGERRPHGTSGPQTEPPRLQIPAHEADPAAIRQGLVFGSRSARWAQFGPWPPLAAVVDQLGAGSNPFQRVSMLGNQPAMLAAVGEIDPVNLRAPLHVDVLTDAGHNCWLLSAAIEGVVADTARAFPIRAVDLTVPAHLTELVKAGVTAGFQEVGVRPLAQYWRGTWSSEVVLTRSGRLERCSEVPQPRS